MPVIHIPLNIMDIVLNGFCKLSVRMLINQRLIGASGCGYLFRGKVADPLAAGRGDPPFGFLAGAADDAHNQPPA